VRCLEWLDREAIMLQAASQVCEDFAGDVGRLVGNFGVLAAALQSNAVRQQEEALRRRFSDEVSDADLLAFVGEDSSSASETLDFEPLRRVLRGVSEELGVLERHASREDALATAGDIEALQQSLLDFESSKRKCLRILETLEVKQVQQTFEKAPSEEDEVVYSRPCFECDLLDFEGMGQSSPRRRGISSFGTPAAAANDSNNDLIFEHPFVFEVGAVSGPTFGSSSSEPYLYVGSVAPEEAFSQTFEDLLDFGSFEQETTCHGYGVHLEAPDPVDIAEMEEFVGLWKKNKNLRALLATLGEILPRSLTWDSLELAELLDRKAVRRAYRKAIVTVHPDKVCDQDKVLGQLVFDALRQGWNEFQTTD